MWRGERRVAVRTGQRRDEVKRLPPAEGYTKINFDAATNKENQKMGIGVIARDRIWEILIALCAAKDFIRELDLTKAYELWRAIELCIELKY